MNKGDTVSWKEQLLEDVMVKDPFNLGTWEAFEKNLKDAFQPYDAPGDALEEMKTLRMGSGLIEEHNAWFKKIVTRSGLDKTSPAVINYYRETLNVPLKRRILSLENPPKTLQEWYNWAAKLDNNWRKMQWILGRSWETNDWKDSNGKKKEEPRRRFNFTCPDPNAMDIDALTIERRRKKDCVLIAKNLDTLVGIVPTKKKQKLLNPHCPTPHQYRRNYLLKNYMCIFIPSPQCWTKMRKRNSIKKQRRRVFNVESRIDIDFSPVLDCKPSHNQIEFVICSNFN